MHLHPTPALFAFLCAFLVLPPLASRAAQDSNSCTRLTTQAISSEIPYFKTWRQRDQFHIEGYSRFVLPPSKMKKKKVLDVACGQGGLIYDLRFHEGIDIWGVDKATGVQTNEILPWFKEGDATALPFQDGEFDLIYNSWAMFMSSKFKDETDEFLIQVLREMNRVLKPGGEVRIMPLSSLTLERFQNLLKKAGGFEFEIIEEIPLPHHEPPRVNYSVRLRKTSLERTL
jgi:SAM-dependent methyltransferase